MSGMLTINLSRPIASVAILADHCEPAVGGRVEKQESIEQASTRELDAQKAVFVRACRTLNGVVEKLNEFCEKMFAGHREEIAHLSVEIARKILMYKVENGDYEIESIVKEALDNAPGREGLAVRLHPDDVAQCQKAQQDEPNGAMAGIRFVSDSNIGRAECLLESPKGIVKSLIDENLERIARALKNG
jgi:flagellar biosynthesis/type III secretory pathway protein FliH